MLRATEMTFALPSESLGSPIELWGCFFNNLIIYFLATGFVPLQATF
jgi:hypothetical protein